MRRTAKVALLFAAAWALAACGTATPDAGAARATRHAPHVLVELQPLPDGHPPVPGFYSRPALPEGHPPIPGYDSRPALPEGHPRCPARDLHGAPSDAEAGRVLQDAPELIST
jgi:hypothetical protein